MRYQFLSFFLILTFTIQAQDAEEVIYKFLEATGGKEKWMNLKTRKAEEIVKVYNSNGFIETVEREFFYTKYYQSPNYYLDVWFEATSLFFNLRCSSDKFVWYYLGKNQVVRFLPEKYIKETSELPRIGVMEILCLPILNGVIDRGGFFRIDFDDEFWNRTISLYFDKESYLIKKKSYKNPSESTLHEFFYKEYKMSNGFLEPRIVENFVDAKKFKTTEIQTIVYDMKVQTKIFDPPVPSSKQRPGEWHVIKESLPFIY